MMMAILGGVVVYASGFSAARHWWTAAYGLAALGGYMIGMEIKQ